MQPATTIGIAYLVARYTQRPHVFGARVLAWPALMWVGRRSYSLYLWQQLFLNPYHGTLLQRFPINTGLALLCAAASYQFIEMPFNHLRRRFQPALSRGEHRRP